MFKNLLQSGIRSKELERKIDQGVEKIKKQAMQEISMACENPEIDPKIIHTEINASFEELKASTRQWFQTRTHKLKKVISKIKLSKIVEEIKEKRESINAKLLPIEVDLKRIVLEYPWHLLWLPIMGVLLVTGIDGMVNFKSIQVLAPSLIVSVLVAILTVAVLGISAHAVGAKIQESDTKPKKWAWFLAGLAGGAVVFFVLGLLRKSFYGTGDSLMGSPVLWTIWNEFFYATAIFISTKYFPTKEQRKRRSKYLNLEKELKALKAEDKRESETLEKAETEEAKVQEQLEQLEAYEEQTLNRLDKQSELLHATLKKEYILKGGKTPTLKSH